MVKFCPTCANMLLVEQTSSSNMRFFCQACPYVHNIYNLSAENLRLDRKKADFIIGSAEDWKNVPETASA
jgi:DNA-directed RNA polymerase III subunit RPC11